MNRIPKCTHATERQQQRGLKNDILQFVLDFGEIEYGTSAVWYVIRERLLPSYLKSSKIAERAKPWVVMAKTIGRNTDMVITVYPNKNPSRHIRRKSHQTLNFKQNNERYGRINRINFRKCSWLITS